jgi:UDP-N-acetylmuramoyl-tripeptide--D-alanyl-D-alanine ligase
MSTPLILIVGLLWFFRTLRSVSAAVARWQQKEYRLDRMRAHLQLPGTRRLLLHPVHLGKWAALVWAIAQPGSARVLLPLLVFTYGAESLLLLREGVERSTLRPKWTAKALLLVSGGIAVTGIVTFGAYRLLDLGVVAAFLLGDRLLLLLVALLVGLAHPCSAAIKSRVIARACAYRETLKDVTVIGITGSYGKSSTKEILAGLLGNRDDVLKTPRNTNTEIGVAGVVLSSLKPSHRTFICEMGAYRRGEIQRIAEIVRPTIGILTAVAPQHLALFGSLEKIRETKYELIRALPPQGTAIINADDPICADLALQTTHCTVVLYGRSLRADIRAEAVRPNERGTTFVLKTPQASQEATVSLPGEQAVSNVLAAAAAALSLGVPLATIVSRLCTLRPFPRTMEPIALADGTLVIDDSYSANPDGVLAALNALTLFSKKEKIVILAPMIELGPAASSAHRRVGRALARSATRVYLPQSDFAKEIAEGVRENGRNPQEFLRVEQTRRSLLHALRPLRGHDTVVLLEGRVPTRFRELLLQETS